MSSHGIDSREAILGLTAYDTSAYETVDLNRLTVFSISILGDRDLPTSLENIAVANYRQFPRRFAMIGYPEFPDASRVSRALLQLRPKYRNWATGNTRTGWVLTQAGEAEAVAVATLLDQSGRIQLTSPRSETRLVTEPAAKRSIDFASEIRRIRETDLFRKSRSDWGDSGNIEVFDVLGAYTHTPSKALRRRLRELKQIAIDAEDAELGEFLAQIGKRFGSLFI